MINMKKHSLDISSDIYWPIKVLVLECEAYQGYPCTPPQIGLVLCRVDHYLISFPHKYPIFAAMLLILRLYELLYWCFLVKWRLNFSSRYSIEASTQLQCISRKFSLKNWLQNASELILRQINIFQWFLLILTMIIRDGFEGTTIFLITTKLNNIDGVSTEDLPFHSGVLEIPLFATFLYANQIRFR